MDTRDRIKLIIETEGVTQVAFAETTGINTSTLNHVLTGRNNPSVDVISKILAAYPQYESDWLLHGSGPMWTEAYSEQQVKSTSIPLFSDSDEDGTGSTPSPVAAPVPNNGVRRGKVEERTREATQTTTERNSSKRVQKVIIYYDDNTFETLYPSHLTDCTKDFQLNY